MTTARQRITPKRNNGKAAAETEKSSPAKMELWVNAPEVTITTGELTAVIDNFARQINGILAEQQRKNTQMLEHLSDQVEKLLEEAGKNLSRNMPVVTPPEAFSVMVTKPSGEAVEMEIRPNKTH